MSCKVDPSIRRVVVGSFQFPLGVYPVDDMTPKPGYAMNFEQADGGSDESDWEEWPDRYVYDVVVSAERLPTLCRCLFSLFEGRIFPILDVLGQDGYREIDPYIAYELVGMDRFYDGVREFGEFLYEDGMVGFGLLTEEPFLYVFVDEHKIVTIRAEPTIREKVEKVLHAFDLEQTEHAAGADATAHEHRGVLISGADRADLLTADDVLEQLKMRWRLLLNIDPDSNIDDEGRPLGTTHWRAVVRCELLEGGLRYAEVVFDADNLRQAEDIAFSACEELADEEDLVWEDAVLSLVDRLRPEQFAQVLSRAGVPAPKAKGTKRSKKTTGTVRAGKGAEAEAPGGKLPAAGRVYVSRWLS